jgi:glycosyltransferase involved in cell wall biosynthesis
MKSPRILFCLSTYSGIGGVETAVNRVVFHLLAEGFDLVVGLVRGCQAHDPDRFRRFHPGLPNVEIDGRGFNREGRVNAIARCIRRLRSEIVVPLGVCDAFEAVVQCKQRGQPVRLVGSGQGNLEPMLADLWDYRDWFDLIICPGQLTRNFLIQRAGFADDRIQHISNGADAPVGACERVAEKAPLRLGYVGRFSEIDKRVTDLPYLMSELIRRGVPFELDLVGDGAVREAVLAALPRQATVRYHGALQHAEVYRRIYPNLDVLLLFSASETFGIVLAEAMAHGVVPVTSRYDGFWSERLVVDGEHGLTFPVGDAGGAADCVQRLHDNRSLLRALARQSAEHAAQFSWSRCLGGWQDALARVAEREPVVGARPPNRPPPNSGRLDRWGVPSTLKDWIRRARRQVMGPAVPSGGEEWPLYYHGHAPGRLVEIKRTLQELERAAEIAATGAACRPRGAT